MRKALSLDRHGNGTGDKAHGTSFIGPLGRRAQIVGNDPSYALALYGFVKANKRDLLAARQASSLLNQAASEAFRFATYPSMFRNRDYAAYWSYMSGLPSQLDGEFAEWVRTATADGTSDDD